MGMGSIHKTRPTVVSRAQISPALSTVSAQLKLLAFGKNCSADQEEGVQQQPGGVSPLVVYPDGCWPHFEKRQLLAPTQARPSAI